MNYSLAIIDLIRLTHLMFFAAGMGVAVFFDWRSIRTLQVPIAQDDLATLHEIHSWITFAFGGLWVTGLMLIYVRTGFDPDSFSPKLITKVLLMSAMVLNAWAIGRYVLPVFGNNVGRCLTDLTYQQLTMLVQCAINSIYCWISGVTLGASVMLKTADWPLLGTVFGLGFVVVTVIGQGSVVGVLSWARIKKTLDQKRSSRAPAG